MPKDQDKQPAPDVGGGGGGRRKSLLLGAAAAALLGGGVAAWLLLGAEEAPDAAADPAPEVAGEPAYHDLKPEFVVNLPPGGKARMLQAALQVYTTDPTLGAVLKKHAPMLRHHLFDLLSAQQADTLYTRAGRERLQGQLRDELINKLQSVGVAKPRVEAVYFTQFVLQ